MTWVTLQMQRSSDGRAFYSVGGVHATESAARAACPAAPADSDWITWDVIRADQYREDPLLQGFFDTLERISTAVDLDAN